MNPGIRFLEIGSKSPKFAPQREELLPLLPPDYQRACSRPQAQPPPAGPGSQSETGSLQRKSTANYACAPDTRTLYKCTAPPTHVHSQAGARERASEGGCGERRQGF